MHKVTIYRLYTESIGDESVADEIIGAHFASFTKFPAQGFWQSKPEKSTVYEIVCMSTFTKGADIEDKLRSAVACIKQRNKQESVLITITEGIGGL